MIYDCFLFFNEFDQLSLRLAELDTCVDFFVLVESKQSLAGASKPLFFDQNRELFTPYLSKIVHVALPGLPPIVIDDERSRFWLERYQRNAILSGLLGCSPQNEDIILLSDVDEIPSRDGISEAETLLLDYDVVDFEQTTYRQFMDQLGIKGRETKRWVGTVATKYKSFSRVLPQELRRGWGRAGAYVGAANPSGDSIRRASVENGGWHLTSFGGPKAVLYKKVNFAHGANDVFGNVRDVPPVPIAQSSVEGLHPLTPQLLATIKSYVSDTLSNDIPTSMLRSIEDYYHLFRASYGANGTDKAGSAVEAELDPSSAGLGNVAMVKTNLALNRPATQSSVSQWSNFPYAEADARGANNGVIDGSAGFHTNYEESPWWQVDLQYFSILSEVHLFNRQICASRLRRFSILISLDGVRWLVVFSKTDDTIFNENDLHPYIIDLAEGTLARFVRVRLDGDECLHFCECEVIGQIADARSLTILKTKFDAQMLEQEREKQRQEEAKQRREEALRAGRRGYIVQIEDNRLFVDVDRYSEPLRQVLIGGGYEGNERFLVKELLSTEDKILEIGTAVGLVAMTAARIVGPENVMSFDANPRIASDAQRNFAYNGLGAIRSLVGVMQNRSRFTNSNEMRSFYISRDFWASRLDANPDDKDIVETVSVRTVCLEDQIARHNATVIICDIEGGEFDLFIGADLTGIRLLIMEIHEWAASRDRRDEMTRYLVEQGFNEDLDRSGYGVVAFHRISEVDPKSWTGS